MNCPCCGNPMEFGYLHSGREPVIWSPKEFKLFAFSGQNEELLIRYGDAAPEAYLCKACRILKY